MSFPKELSFDECVGLLNAGVMGRVALTTPDGAHILPLNYSVMDDAVVIATSPYSVLGTYGRGSMVAFEVDSFDYEHHTGWSVVVRGRVESVDDPEEIQRLRRGWAPRPWADGARNLYLRIPWKEISGRRVGDDAEPPVRRVVGIP